MTILYQWYKIVIMKIKRSVFSNLGEHLEQPNVLILLGARQVGKSTLMEMLMESARKSSRPFLSFNLEFPDDLLFFSRTPSEVFDDLTREPNTLIFIDEFHYLENVSKLFKAIYDKKKNIKIIASGSSSLEVHRHLKESLAGRRSIVQIFPLSLQEWQTTQDKEMEDFIVYGGMPGLIHIPSKNEKIEYLSQMVQTYLMKDVKALIREENIRAFNHLLFYLAENQGQIMPTSNIAREIRVSHKTVEHYLNILEQTFVLHGLHSFSGKLSNELKKSKKYYFYDNGIRNSLLKDFSSLSDREDRGILYESYAFLELYKMSRANTELRFWRTKQGDEVDFIWIENRRPIPIEIKSTYKQNIPHKGIVKFLKSYPESPYALIFNKNRSEDWVHEGHKIKLRQFCQIHKLPWQTTA